MGDFAIPLMIAATVGSTAVSVKSQIDAGNVARKEGEIAARREGDAARAREIDRRRKLLASLASQSAEAGALGVAPNEAVARADIDYAANDLLTDQYNTATEQRLLRYRGRNAQRAGKLGAVTSILDAGAKSFETLS